VIAGTLNHAGIPSPARRKWSKAAISYILRNRAYLGQSVARVWVRPKGGGPRRFDLTNPEAIVIDGAHEPLVDAATWEAAHSRDGSTGGSPAVLTGLLWIDGQRVAITHRRNGRPMYRPRLGVPGVGIAADEALELVWGGFVAQLRRPATLLELLEQSGDADRIAVAEAAVEVAERTRGRLENRLARLVDMCADGDLDRAAFRERHEATSRQLRATEESIRALRRQLAAVRDGHAGRQVLAVARLAAAAGKLSAQQRRAALVALVERIDATVIDRGEQARGKAGHYAKRAAPRWGLGDVYLRLRDAGGCAPLS
jgi:hypothetical protein